MTSSSLRPLAAASGLDIRAEDLEQAISRRNPDVPRERIEQIVDLIGRIAEISGAMARLHHPAEPFETMVGAGFGERLDGAEGARRLSSFASHLSLGDWAGSVAGPAEITARLGIPRSTLDDWRRSGAAIGLLKGARKHVFPLAQFVDGRPIPGLAEVTAIIGDSRATWLWLVEPHRHGAPTWLERLQRGELSEVKAAAREDFA